jgi:hypothetical protein
LAGYVSWIYVRWGPNSASRCPMIGIGLLSGARGRGIGRAAQRALAELFFTHTVVNRVEAHTDVDNIAEQRALEAAGFTREGLIRGAQWRDGAYSLIRQRPVFRRRVAPPRGVPGVGGVVRRGFIVESLYRRTMLRSGRGTRRRRRQTR